MPAPAPRFGIWTLVYGATGSLFHPDEPVDATWERNKRLILEAEALGYESTLVAQHLFHPRDDNLDQLETWTACAALAALTSRIEIIAAIKPTLFHPAVLAKMATQIEEISHGRFAINFVNAWFKPELERAGISFAAHDARYAYGKEWIGIVRDLMAGERVTFRGKHFSLDGYQLRPAGRYRPRPVIYAGGESEAGRDVAVTGADVWFINGQPLEDVQALIADVSARPRAGAKLRYALSAFVIARQTEAEAQAELARGFAIADQDAELRRKLTANTDPSVVMFQTIARTQTLGSNGGTAAGLVGSYDQVAARIVQFAQLGIETFMLQFQPTEPEMRRFAHEVRPRVARQLARAA
jgi:alkanesulfonate monooxygenase